MAILVGGLLALFAFGMVMLDRLVSRPPRCPICRIPSEPVSDALSSRYPQIIRVAYLCPRCLQVVACRFIGPELE